MDLTSDSELLVKESIDCGANELIVARGFGGGGVGDLRGDGEAGRGDGGRSTPFGTTTTGSGLGTEEKPEVVAIGMIFNGGGGIIPLL